MNQPFSVPFQHPFTPDKNYTKSVAYFSMEFALDQALKSYSGGLGFLGRLTYEKRICPASEFNWRGNALEIRIL